MGVEKDGEETRETRKRWDCGEEEELEEEVDKETKKEEGQQESRVCGLFLVCTNIQHHQITDVWHGYGQVQGHRKKWCRV